MKLYEYGDKWDVLRTSIVVAFILIMSAFIGYGLNISMHRPEAVGPFGKQQTPEQVVARYQSCKAKAPKGMDCVMIPMLVSDEFMREHGDE